MRNLGSNRPRVLSLLVLLTSAVPVFATRTVTMLSATTDIYGYTNPGSGIYDEDEVNPDLNGFSSSLFDQSIATTGSGVAESRAVQNLVMNYDGGTGDLQGLTFVGEAYAETVLVTSTGESVSGSSTGESHLYVAFTVTEETPWSISNGVAYDATNLFTRPGLNVRLQHAGGGGIYNYFPPLPPNNSTEPFSAAGVLDPGEYELVAYIAAESQLFVEGGQGGVDTSEGSIEFVFTLPEPTTGMFALLMLCLLPRRSRA